VSTKKQEEKNAVRLITKKVGR